MIRDDNALTVTVLHELYARLRAELSHPLPDPVAFERELRSHEGIAPLRYTPAVRTILVRFDPMLIRREELLVRIALAMSLQHGNRPVRIEAAPPLNTLTVSVAASGAILLAAWLGRSFGFKSANLKALDVVGGLATGSAVLSHAVRELRQQGAYHPEVIAVVYLAIGMLRGHALRSAVLTWFASFGRHLLESRAEAVEVRPYGNGDAPEVTASAIRQTGWRAWLEVLPSLLRAFIGAGSPKGDLLSNLQEVSHLHDKMLDALGPWKKGIPLRIGDKPITQT
jgi:hypothetical protein